MHGHIEYINTFSMETLRIICAYLINKVYHRRLGCDAM
jgi:hypothetical protein